MTAIGAIGNIAKNPTTSSKCMKMLATGLNKMTEIKFVDKY